MDEFTYWVNGEFTPASKAVIPINSRGYRLGDGVFDTERTFNGEIFRLEHHLKRLERSLRYTRIDPGYSLDELGRISQEAVERNEDMRKIHGDFWVTQTISRDGGIFDSNSAFVSIIIDPLPWARAAPYFEKGLTLVTPSVRSAAVAGLDPKVKATSRLYMVMADIESKQHNADAWTLLLDEEGNLAEVLYGNLFVAREGKLLTPNIRSILGGVTRETTIELATELGLAVEEKQLQPYDLYTADEAFVTSTSYCVLPVGTLNGSAIGQQVPGPLTQRLTEAWNRLAGMDVAAQFKQYAHVAPEQAPIPPAV